MYWNYNVRKYQLQKAEAERARKIEIQTARRAAIQSRYAQQLAAEQSRGLEGFLNLDYVPRSRLSRTQRFAYEEARDLRKLLRLHGVPDFVSIDKLNADMLQKMKKQQQSAQKRGIAWEFTFKEFRLKWISSGHWIHRGTSKTGYVMGRCGDVGPYSYANTEIITNTQNIRDGHANAANRRRATAVLTPGPSLTTVPSDASSADRLCTNADDTLMVKPTRQNTKVEHPIFTIDRDYPEFPEI